MWEAIGQAIKTFVEKHLIPTVISVVVAIASFLILPADFWMIERIGKVPFALLVAGIVFLIIQLLIFLFRKIHGWLSNKSAAEYRFRNDVKLEKEVLEKIWSEVDALSPDDRKVLKGFVASNNAPIEKSSGSRYFGNSLFNSNWVVSTEEYVEEEKTAVPVHLDLPKKQKGQVMTVNIMDMYDTRTIIVKYKLRDDIYNLLKYSMENYGKISHFE
ncbi:MAG: hypothetical protein IJA47_05525 [Oscillospiraceae bacterium]|nr:hypothetical protein [Oscillospiraceae bacterium]